MRRHHSCRSSLGLVNPRGMRAPEPPPSGTVRHGRSVRPLGRWLARPGLTLRLVVSSPARATLAAQGLGSVDLPAGSASRLVIARGGESLDAVAKRRHAALRGITGPRSPGGAMRGKGGDFARPVCLGGRAAAPALAGRDLAVKVRTARGLLALLRHLSHAQGSDVTPRHGRGQARS